MGVHGTIASEPWIFIQAIASRERAHTADGANRLPAPSTAALKMANSPPVTDRQRLHMAWGSWIRAVDSWLPALDLDESVVAIGAPGLAGGVEVGDGGQVQTRDDVGLERPEGSD